MTRKTFTSIAFALSMLFAFIPSVPAGASRPHLITVPTLYRTSGPGVRYPDATDPTRLLPRIDQLAAACIRFYESKNHRIDGDAYGTGAGWYQFISSTWHSAAVALHFPPRIQWDANKATGDEQSAVFVWYFKRNGRFGVQWAGDAARCPGTFFF